MCSGPRCKFLPSPLRSSLNAEVIGPELSQALKDGHCSAPLRYFGSGFRGSEGGGQSTVDLRADVSCCNSENGVYNQQN